ncbi:hypothetical protein ES705_33617 [subsurface metagenome]
MFVSFLMENQIIGMLIGMVILAFLVYLSYKISGINKYDREKDYKKETKDESDLEVK